ncbi:ankyrin repeat-containing protein [Ophiostoma piceae UAMH 11346]|uniref:Ankyrin repeat-containing protein n=1 Tax=Ophiostoma piceae (strain UAMH 11346) TaxID=1262450 RepID=S3C9Z4_OPHP1|nr:ankyrin repeat-containing protein [Ophiostoma piceae UAMH 11346]
MATQDHHDHNGPSVDADAALRAAFRRMSGTFPDPIDEEAYAFVRSMCPALSSGDKYSHCNGPEEFGHLHHMHEVIEADDLPAMQELIRIQPGLLTYECPGDFLCPLMVLAAQLSRHAILDILMKYRATLPPEMLVLPQYGEDDDFECGNWGTPLTAACRMGRFDTVRLLLQGMPDTDINEVGPNGLTPFLAAAEGGIGPPEVRVQLIRFLIERGADIYAVKQDFEHFYDESLKARPLVLRRPVPGGRGNALARAMDFNNTAPEVLAVLVEAGVNVYQSHVQSHVGILKSINESDGQDSGRHKSAYFSPMAIGAQHHNVVGVAALLHMFPDDHGRLLTSTDVILVPQRRALLRDPEDEVPVMLPLHAALTGAYSMDYIWTTDQAKSAVNMVRLFTADKAICAATINTPYRHYTPLHITTGFDRMTLLLALIELGADSEVPRPDGHGLILALFSSIARISHKYLHFSTSWAVDVDASTDMMAVFTKLLKRYSPRGKDGDVDAQNAATRIALINEADTNGNTPLYFATAYQMPKSTAALMALGARTTVANDAAQVPHTLPLEQEQSF